MKPSLRLKLNIIDKWLGGIDGRELAAVLGALRGPDSESTGGVKHETTAIIRAVAFPKTAVRKLEGSVIPWSMRRDKTIIDEPPGRIEAFCGRHFAGHIHEAAVALRIPLANKIEWIEWLKK